MVTAGLTTLPEKTTDMEIKTKFNVGDRVFSVDRETVKIVNFNIARICVFVRERANVSYSDEEGRDYEENACFMSMDELINHMMPKK